MIEKQPSLNIVIKVAKYEKKFPEMNDEGTRASEFLKVSWTMEKISEEVKKEILFRLAQRIRATLTFNVRTT